MSFKEYIKKWRYRRKCKQMMRLLEDLCRDSREETGTCVGCSSFLVDDHSYCGQVCVLRQALKVWLGESDEDEEDNE